MILQVLIVCIVALNLGCLVAYVNILADVLSSVAGSIIPPGAEPSRNALLTGVQRPLFATRPRSVIQFRQHPSAASLQALQHQSLHARCCRLIVWFFLAEQWTGSMQQLCVLHAELDHSFAIAH